MEHRELSDHLGQRRVPHRTVHDAARVGVGLRLGQVDDRGDRRVAIVPGMRGEGAVRLLERWRTRSVAAGVSRTT